MQTRDEMATVLGINQHRQLPILDGDLHGTLIIDREVVPSLVETEVGITSRMVLVLHVRDLVSVVNDEGDVLPGRTQMRGRIHSR